MLFDHRMQDRGWLLRYTELNRNNIDAFLRLAGFEELHYLRRYCGKLIYEVEAYGDDTDWKALPDLYVDTLSRATTFQYRTADAFVDFDPRYYSTRYLRAGSSNQCSTSLWCRGSTLTGSEIHRQAPG